MSNVYAEVGQSFQQIGGECPVGCIVMQCGRPNPDYIAASDGTWQSAKLTTAQIRDLRRIAYSDSLTGSDKLFIEYQRDLAMNLPDTEVQLAKQRWLERAEEIAQQYPWPTEE